MEMWAVRPLPSCSGGFCCRALSHLGAPSAPASSLICSRQPARPASCAARKAPSSPSPPAAIWPAPPASTLPTYSVCPVCGRRLDPSSPYLARRDLEPATDEARPGRSLRLVAIWAGSDRLADAARLRDSLAGRPGALPEADLADPKILVEATAAGQVAWLPDPVPSKET